MERRKFISLFGAATATGGVLVASEAKSAEVCANCDGGGWVCENHEDHPWGGTSSREDGCGCGAGAPCPVCNKKMAFSGMAYDILDALNAQYPAISKTELYALLGKVRA